MSEHFVDHHANQIGSMSDSDFSEVDSDFPSEGHSSENNNTFACIDDSNGNNIVEASVTPTSTKNDNLSTVEEILRTVFESNSSHLSTAIEMFAEKEKKGLAAEHTDIDSCDYCVTDIDACDLKTYLEHYDDGINITNIESFAKKIDSPTENEPDVIKKSNSCEKGFEQQSVDKPDILLDVTENAENLAPSNGEAWSITPVDIVGNFEQEVERELGLLVTGYKCNSFSQDDVDTVDAPVSSNGASNDKFMDKVCCNLQANVLCVYFSFFLHFENGIFFFANKKTEYFLLYVLKICRINQQKINNNYYNQLIIFTNMLICCLFSPLPHHHLGNRCGSIKCK